jgi:hypothetical protein
LLAIIILSIAIPSLYFYNNKLININPYQGEENVLSYLGYYKVLQEVYSRNYSYARTLLNALNKTTSFQNEKNLIYKFNQYFNLTITQLNETKSNISLANYYLSINFLNGAYNASQKALIALKNANYSTIWLSYFASEIYNTIGSYNYIEEVVNGLKNSEGNLTNEIYSILSEINMHKGNVTVNLLSNSTYAWIGNVTRIFGNVTYLRKPLSNATVELIFPDYSKNITTKPDGQFTYNYKIPSIYNNKTCIYAVFIPEKNYSKLNKNSSYICINTKFIKPSLKVSINQTYVLPYHYIKVHFNINNINQNVNKTVLIYLLKYGLIKSINFRNNNYTADILIPDVANGNYTLVAVLLSNGIYDNSSSIVFVNIYRLIPKMKINIPSIVFTGETLTLNGFIYYNKNGLSNSTIIISYLGKNVSEQTNNEGEFKIKLTIPVTYMNSDINFTIYGIPNESYYGSIHSNKKITVLNPLALVIGGVFIYAASKYFYNTEKERKENKKQKSKNEEKSKIQKEKGENDKKNDIIDKRRIALKKAFNNFSSYIFYNYNIELEENMTLREYFNNIMKKRRDIKDKLEKILNLIEKEIYGKGLDEEEFSYLISLLLGDYK